MSPSLRPDRTSVCDSPTSPVSIVTGTTSPPRCTSTCAPSGVCWIAMFGTVSTPLASATTIVTAALRPTRSGASVGSRSIRAL